MGMTFTDGNITTTASEQDLFDITADAHFATWVFCHNMASGDSVTIRVYAKDENGTTMRLYAVESLFDAQTVPAYFIPFIPAKQYKVSIQRTAGTDRNYTWQRVQVS